jgi:hypothetical protein
LCSFAATLAGAGLTLLRPARRGEPERPGTRFFKPLRVLQRILALTAAIWHNDRTGRPVNARWSPMTTDPLE